MDNKIIADLVVLLLLVIGVFVGAKRGLFRSLASLVIVAAALLITAKVTTQLSPMLTEKIYPIVSERIVSVVQEKGLAEAEEAANDSQKMEDIFSKLPEGLRERLEGFGITPETAGGYIEQFGDQAAEKGKALAEEYAYRIVSAVVRAVLGIFIFLLILLILKLLVRLLNQTLFKLPVVRQLNRIGGAVFGAAECALLILLVLWLAELVGISYFRELSEGTRLLSFFQAHTFKL